MATVYQPTGTVGRGSAPSLTDFVRRAFDTFDLWYERAASRRQLASLDAHMLSDIGLTEADAWEEVRKPFWRA